MRSILYLHVLLALVMTGCSIFIPPAHLDVNRLNPELKASGNTSLYTQTFWNGDSGTVLVQIMTIDDFNIGDKYIYRDNFRKLSYFPGDSSFGKKLIIVPPGRHDVKLSYNGEGRYLIGSMNLEHRELISHKVTVPADSTCVFTPMIEDFEVDIYKPDIRLKCRKNNSSSEDSI